VTEGRAGLSGTLAEFAVQHTEVVEVRGDLRCSPSYIDDFSAGKDRRRHRTFFDT